MGRCCLREQKFWSTNAQHGRQYCVTHFRVAKRLDCNCPHHKQRNDNYVTVVEVLASMTIILQYLNVSNQALAT